MPDYCCIVTDKKGMNGIMFEVPARSIFVAFNEAMAIGRERIGIEDILTSVSEIRNEGGAEGERESNDRTEDFRGNLSNFCLVLRSHEELKEDFEEHMQDHRMGSDPEINQLLREIDNG
jgi:hypothetical protein